MIMAVYLDFKVQQVAVNFVVNVGVILLLAQVQTWDVHGRLEADNRCKNHNYCFPYASTQKHAS